MVLDDACLNIVSNCWLYHTAKSSPLTDELCVTDNVFSTHTGTLIIGIYSNTEVVNMLNLSCNQECLLGIRNNS